ncbi:MAG: hypothetical protein JRI72_07835 [Deltaproteobacteria bacterium]|nr:hypothetical protein [Deltaproteobacteria bacterium]
MTVKVSLKYCGGCNPEYDRVALVKHIQESLHDKVEFVKPESEGVRFILAVEGCSTACADLSAFQGMEIRVITNTEGGERFIKEIRKQISEAPRLQGGASKRKL